MAGPDPPLAAHPPYRVATRRLELRCWDPADAAELAAVLADNVEHLGPWMPWARGETGGVDAKVALLRAFRGRFDLGEDFAYGAFDRESGAVVGGCGLHPRAGPCALEIGYWVRRDRVGSGLATEMAGALTRVGIEHVGARRIEIRCAPENERSQRIPRRLGFAHEGRLRARLAWPDGTMRDVEVFTLLDAELAGSPCADVPLERVLDALGRDQARLERADGAGDGPETVPEGAGDGSGTGPGARTG